MSDDKFGQQISILQRSDIFKLFDKSDEFFISFVCAFEYDPTVQSSVQSTFILSRLALTYQQNHNKCYVKHDMQRRKKELIHRIIQRQANDKRLWNIRSALHEIC